MTARSVNSWVPTLVVSAGVLLCSCTRRDGDGEPARNAPSQPKQPVAAKQPEWQPPEGQASERQAPQRQVPERQPSPLVSGEAKGVLTATGTVSAIHGWAWDPTQPDLAVAVDIYEGDTLLGSILANKHQKYLVKLGIGDGKHAFSYPFPSHLRDGKTHLVSAKIAVANIELQKSPQSLTYAPPKKVPQGPEKKTAKP